MVFKRFCLFLVVILFILVRVDYVIPVDPSNKVTFFQNALKNFSYQDLDLIEQKYRGQSEEIISILTQKLNQIYKSYPTSNKYDVHQADPILSSAESFSVEVFNTNIRRLAIREFRFKPATGFFIASVQPLYLLHKKLATNLLQLSIPQPRKALFHLQQALRYRKLNLVKEEWWDPNRLLFLPPYDPAIVQANRHRNITEKITTLTQDVKNLHEQQIVMEDSLTYTSQIRLIKQKLKKNRIYQNEVNKELIKLKASNQSQDDLFQDIKKKWEHESASLVWSIVRANQVHEITNRVSVDTNIYIDWAITASHLAPDKPQYYFALGELYKHDKRAIHAFKEAIDLYYKNPETDAFKKESYIKACQKLAGLYVTHNEYLSASHYYHILAIATEEPVYWFTLGKLYTTKIGNAVGAITALQKYMSSWESIKVNPNNKIDQAQFLSQKVYTLLYLSKNLSKLQRYDDSIQKAKMMQDKMDEIVRFTIKAKLATQQAYQTFHDNRAILRRKNKSQKEQEKFYNLEKTYQDKQATYQNLLSIKQSLPWRDMYFSLADSLRKQNNIREAIQVYQLAERQGIDSQQAHSAILQLEKLID